MSSTTFDAIQKIKSAEAKAIENTRKKIAKQLQAVAKKVDFAGEEAALVGKLRGLYELADEIAAAVPGFRFRAKFAVVSRSGAAGRPAGSSRRGGGRRGAREGSLKTHILAVLSESKKPLDKDAIWDAVKARGYASKTKNHMNTLGVTLSNLKSEGVLNSFKQTGANSFSESKGKERGRFYALTGR